MTITIPDDVLHQAGLTEREALTEFACRLFDAGKLALWPAAKLAQLSRAEFEHELITRHIAIYRLTAEELQHDLETLRELGI